MELQIGDRVRVADSTPNYSGYNNLKGKTGTVLEIDGEYMDFEIGIEFDECVNGHNLHGQGKQGHCFWISVKFVELAESSTIKEVIKKKFKSGRNY